MGIRMYLGPSNGGEIDDPEPPPDGGSEGPPIVVIPDLPPDDPDPTPPPPPPPTGTCNNVFQDTCPGNGAWSYNIWQFHNSGGTWTTYNIHRMKAGAYVAGKIMNDGSLRDCLDNYSSSDFQGGTSWPDSMSKPSGLQFYNDLYSGTNRSGTVDPCSSCNSASGWATRSGGANDHQADVEYFLMYSTSSTVLAASTVPGNYIRFNINNYTSTANKTPSSTAANMMHEYSHSVDYGHCSSCSDRSTSYPYRLGSCVSSVGSRYNAEARAKFPNGNW
jgi:hypothetical protein